MVGIILRDQIQQWLERLFAGGETQVPDYEVNSHTVNFLYSMAKQSDQKDTVAKIATEDIKQKIEEYTAESESGKV